METEKLGTPDTALPWHQHFSEKNIMRAVVLFIIGIVFLVETSGQLTNTFELIGKAKTADGVVVATPHAARHPRIEYTNSAGEKRCFLANEWITGFRIISYKAGEHVRVLYDPANPAAFSVDDFESLYAVPITGGVVGIVFIVFGLCALAGKVAIQEKDMAGVLMFIFVGCVFLYFNFEIIRVTREFIGKAEVADGVVYEITPRKHLNIEYTLATKKYRFSAQGMISGYEVGEHVRVLFDPADPDRAEIDDFGSLYGAVFICESGGIFGILMGILGLLGVVEFKPGR